MMFEFQWSPAAVVVNFLNVGVLFLTLVLFDKYLDWKLKREKK